MTTLTAPIAKLYKRCARGKHDTCPGSFESWSVCSCDCHAGISDTRPVPVSCADVAPAIAEAIEIVTPAPAPTQPAPNTDGAINFGFKGTHRVGTDGLNVRKLMRWTEHFHMCAACAETYAKVFASMEAAAKSTFAAGRMDMCADCQAATKQALRAYALSPAYARVCATEVRNANDRVEHLKPVYLHA